jgi:hypothetical protein
VRLLLIAESHVYTSSEDLSLRIRLERLPVEAQHVPTEYVRLVYCLGYGETSVLSGKPIYGNAGTWQFWNIFGRIAETGRQPTRDSMHLSERLAWKVKTLRCLREKGIWLIDSSLHGIYTPGAMRVSVGLTHKTTAVMVGPLW